jgi:hypothetical protein
MAGHNWVKLVAEAIMTQMQWDGDYDLATAQRCNAAGWTIDTNAPLGGWVRHEGVTLSDADLARAYNLGEHLLAEVANA